MNSWKLLAVLVVVCILSYVTYRRITPESADASASAREPCEPQIPCPNSCLKREAPGWTARIIAGHDPNDVWMTFKAPNGSTRMFNQHHVGHIIQVEGSTHVDKGVCPTCAGATRVCANGSAGTRPPPPAP